MHTRVQKKERKRDSASRAPGPAVQIAFQILHTFTFRVSEFPVLLPLPASKIKYHEIKLKWCNSKVKLLSRLGKGP